MVAEIVTAEGEVVPAAERAEFPDARLNSRFVVTRGTTRFVLYAGLLDLLHQTSGGLFAIETDIVQLPAAENAQTAICRAVVRVFDPHDADVVRRVTTGIGDANAGNVNRGMDGHVIRLAETRAKARALRDAVNVGMAALEELGPEGAGDQPEARSRPSSAQSPSFDPPPGPRPTDSINVGGRTFSREEVQRTYHQRVREAKAAGLAGLEELDDLVPGTTPLSLLVGKSQELRRRIDAKAGLSRTSTGK